VISQDLDCLTRFSQNRAIFGFLAGSSLPWIEKFRPKDLSEIISNEDVISTSALFL
jgi:hypothetical protein